MTDDPRTVRVCMMMAPAEIATIDDWRYAQHIPTRAEAMRLLIQRSLDAENAEKKQAKDPDK